mmetsp:Transcript_31126/g.62107  ORF Transcript_31126/g.62107 Transcript_31126/m.62107 type:complete len:142 (-) Transcript_31126:264-689(-)
MVMLRQVMKMGGRVGNEFYHRDLSLFRDLFLSSACLFPASSASARCPVAIALLPNGVLVAQLHRLCCAAASPATTVAFSGARGTTPPCPPRLLPPPPPQPPQPPQPPSPPGPLTLDEVTFSSVASVHCPFAWAVLRGLFLG